jgi:uncharacterized membrane protein
MNALVFWLMITYVFTGLLLVGVSVPLIQRRVRPDLIYGFRTPKTLSDENVWYEANAYSGRMLLRAGAASTVAALMFFFVPGIGNNLPAYSIACTLALLVSLFAAVFSSFRYLRSL